MQHLGRTVVHRDRLARSWKLGDRTRPLSTTPGIVLLEGDVELDIKLAPFSCKMERTLPSKMYFSSRANLDPFSEEPGPNYESSVGFVLPPVLEEANAGEMPTGNDVLVMSWQRLRHDETILEADLRPSIIVLVDAPQLTAHQGRLIDSIIAIKKQFPGALLWTPGISGPDNIALLSWFGVDLHDMARSRLAKANGLILTQDGPRNPLEGESLDYVAHFEHAINSTRAALAEGWLRNLAEKQSLNSPKMVEHLRHFSRASDSVSGLLKSVVGRDYLFECLSPSALNDPMVKRWHRFMENEYTCPPSIEKILILLPCSATKPYSSSPTHRKFIREIGHSGIHELMITSPLAIVPRDLESVWPAAHYDLPVTGDWSVEEISIIHEVLIGYLKRHSYNIIINHTNIPMPDLGMAVISTTNGESPTSAPALERLRQVVREQENLKKRKGEKINLDTFKSISRFMFNNDAWLSDCRIRGKFPDWKVEKDGQQIAVWSTKRGAFSISKVGLSVMHEHKTLPEVIVKEDRKLVGDLHLGLLESWPEDLKVGEEVLLIQKGVLVGSARVLAPSWEWNGTPGRLAKLRHKLSSDSSK